MEIKAKVSYLAGLLDGMNYDEDTNEGKLFYAILDVLEEIADEVDDLADSVEELEEFVEALDEDLDDLEDFLEMDDDDEDDNDELIDIECAACGFMNSFDPAIIWETGGGADVHCTNCGAVIFAGGDFDFDDDDFDFDEDDEDDDD